MSGNSYTQIKQTLVKNCRDKEGHCIVMKGLIYQVYIIIIISMYPRSSRYRNIIRPKERESNTIIMVERNILLSSMVTSSISKIN